MFLQGISKEVPLPKGGVPTLTFNQAAYDILEENSQKRQKKQKKPQTPTKTSETAHKENNIFEKPKKKHCATFTIYTKTKWY